MGYEILSNDLYSEKSDKKSKKKDSKKKIKINPIYIHILLIIVILGFLIYNFFPNFNSSNEEKLGNLLIVGDLENFNKSYDGNLDFYSKKFILETKDRLSGNSKGFKIENFSGQIYLENNSIVFEGIAKKIKYDKNNINLNNEKFKLTSMQKTNFNTFFNKLDLKILNGRLKLDSKLNYEFTNSSIKIYNINSSINYDGTFAISGIVKKFYFENLDSKLKLSFNNE